MSDEHQYRLIYTIEAKPDGIKKADIPKDCGATDAVLIASIMYSSDGSSNTAFVSVDGATNRPMDVNEIFKVWTLLAIGFINDMKLQDAWRFIAQTAFKLISAELQKRRAGEAKETGH